MPLDLFHDVLKHFYVYPFFSRPLLLLLSVFVLRVLALFACVLSFISCISRFFAQQSILDSTHAQIAFLRGEQSRPQSPRAFQASGGHTSTSCFLGTDQKERRLWEIAWRENMEYFKLLTGLP